MIARDPSGHHHGRYGGIVALPDEILVRDELADTVAEAPDHGDVLAGQPRMLLELCDQDLVEARHQPSPFVRAISRDTAGALAHPVNSEAGARLQKRE